MKVKLNATHVRKTKVSEKLTTRPKHATSGVAIRNETSMFACGQNCGAKPITCVIPTGMRTAEKTRLKASKAVSSRTRPVALRTKRPWRPTCASAAVVATFPPLAVRGGEGTPTRRLWDGGIADDELNGQDAPFGAGRMPFDQVDGQLCCLLSEPRKRLPDRGEGGRDERGDEDVVKADDGEIARDDG